MNRPLTLYYAATVVFLILDYVLSINVRIAFLEPWPAAKLAYYAICFGCLALMIWRPAWTDAIAVVESLTAVVALTLSMGVRVLSISDTAMETGQGFVTTQEIVNYLIVGVIAYSAYVRSVKSLKSSKIY